MGFCTVTLKSRQVVEFPGQGADTVPPTSALHIINLEPAQLQLKSLQGWS